jgi:radical SAM superfamily enzyme YgiQ (UPF0313 family)
MKVFLVYPPWNIEEKLSGYSREMMKDVEAATSPPLGLAYIAAVLEKAGHDVKIFDCQFLDQYDLFFNSLRKEKPDIVGVSVFTASVNSTFDLINRVKKILPRTKIIVGGPHAGAAPEHCLKNRCIDIVVIGEGEVTILGICSGKPLGKIEGIVYRSGGKIKYNRLRKPIENLDSLPFPDRDLLPSIYRYRTEIEKLAREPYTSMFTSRGCPYRCIYCSKTVFGRSFRARSAKNVVDEMEFLINKYKVKHIHIYDDTFNNDPKRVFDICNEIIKRGLDVTWDCESRVNTMSRELLKKMAEAGCTSVGYGVESADQNILNTLQKDVDLKKVKDAVRWAREAGIRTRCYFIIGSPGETKDTVRKTIDFAKEANPDFALYSILTPFPGTQLFDWLREKKLIKEDQYVVRDIIQMGELTPGELKKALNQAYREFYLRPGSILNHLKSINNLFMLKSYMRMASGFLKKYFFERTPLE